jgi:hypothetical protein
MGAGFRDVEHLTKKGLRVVLEHLVPARARALLEALEKPR